MGWTTGTGMYGVAVRDRKNYDRVRKQWRKIMGLCADCNKWADGYERCPEHREANALTSAKWRERKKLSAALSLLILAGCGISKPKPAGLISVVPEPPKEIVVQLPRCGPNCDGYGCNQAITKIVHRGAVVQIEVTTPSWATVGIEDSTNLLNWSLVTDWHSTECGKVCFTFPADSPVKFYRVTTDHP